MKAFTRTVMLLGVVLLTFPMLADEPAGEPSKDQESVFGADLFDDVRLAINHQAGTDFTVYASDLIIDADAAESSEFRAQVNWGPWGPWASNLATWQMVDEDSQASGSFYVNDSWQMDEPWSFEVDENATDADGE